MTFNFGAFMGGAVDQYNRGVAADQRQQQIDQQGDVLQEQIASSKQQREERERQAEQLKQAQAADDAMSQALAENMAKVGETPEPVVTETPALLAAPTQPAQPVQAQPVLPPVAAAMPPVSSNAGAPPSATPAAGLVLPANIGVPAAVSQGAGAAPKRDVSVTPGGLDQYQKSDALMDTAKRLARLNVPAYSARAAKLMELAQVAKGQEAWDMAAQTGDYGAAMTHLSGRKTEFSTAPDGSLVMTDPKTGKTLDTFKDGDEFLSRLGAIRSPEAFATYQKNVSANLKAQLDRERLMAKDQADMLYKAGMLGQKNRELDLRAENNALRSGGGAGGNGSASTYEKMLEGVVTNVAGKESDSNVEQRQRARGLADNVIRMNVGLDPVTKALVPPNPTQVATAVSAVLRAPERIMIRADDQTGNLFGYIDGGGLGGVMKVATLQQIQQGGLLAERSKDGTVAPLTGDALTQRIESQGLEARQRWLDSPKGRLAAEMYFGLTEQEKQNIRYGQGSVRKDGKDVPVSQIPDPIKDAIKNAAAFMDAQAQALEARRDKDRAAAAQQAERRPMQLKSMETASNNLGIGGLVRYAPAVTPIGVDVGGVIR